MIKDRAGVAAPPPLIFAAALVIAWLLRGWLPRAGSVIGGGACILTALAIAGAAIGTMTRAKTSVDPYAASTALVTAGPFRWSRNPIYVALTLLYCGAALYARIPAAFLLLPLALWALVAGVIRREERYLEGKFGDDYRAYRSRVRRWL